MIDLYCFGPAFLLPSPGPFAMKTEAQLRMAALPYTKRMQGIAGAPKGKLPWIDDDGTIVADSALIRMHLEKRYAKDLDAGFDLDQRALAWSIEKMVEDNLYFMLVYTRWQIDDNFAKGPAHFFDHLPEAVQDEMRQKQRRAVLANLYGQGTGRHGYAEVGVLADLGYAALARLLGDKPYLLGDRPCGADASVFAQLAGILTPFFDGPVRDAARRHANLVDYADRLMAEFFPGQDLRFSENT